MNINCGVFNMENPKMYVRSANSGIVNFLKRSTNQPEFPKMAKWGMATITILDFRLTDSSASGALHTPVSTAAAPNRISESPKTYNEFPLAHTTHPASTHILHLEEEKVAAGIYILARQQGREMLICKFPQKRFVKDVFLVAGRGPAELKLISILEWETFSASNSFFCYFFLANGYTHTYLY